MLIRRLGAADHSDVLRIARTVPQWFTAKGIEMMRVDLHYHHGFLAERDGATVGFVTFFTHEGAGRIGWIAVSPDHHRQGIGRALIEAVITEFGKHGLSEIQVKTLSDSVAYEPYERTRKFYSAMGFVESERIPGEEGNPERPDMLVLTRAI